MKEQKKDRLGMASGNYILMLVALLVMTAGYFIMAANEITVSPILLVIAYIVIVPLSLIIKFKKKD
jgi:membrane protein YdbS with pleckstrin-like domain